MKKVLLGASALVMAGLMAAPAQAQLEARVGLDVRAMMGAYDHDRAGDAEFNSGSFRTDWRMPVSVSGTADNGLNYGALLRLRNQVHTGAAGQQGLRFDQAFVHMSGNWGRLEIGDNWGAMTMANVMAPVVGIGQVDGASPITTGIAAPYSDATFEGTDSRIYYRSPSFSGFTVHVSYSPEHPARGNSWNTSNATRRINNVYQVAANYSGEFNGIGIDVGGGYSGGQWTGGVAVANEANREIFEVGANVSWGGLTIGGIYYDNGRTGGDDRAGRLNGWSAGASYTMGAWSFAGSLASATARPFGGPTQTDTLYSLGVNYAIAPGLSASADFYATDLGTVRKNLGVDRVRGNAGVARLRVTF